MIVKGAWTAQVTRSARTARTTIEVTFAYRRMAHAQRALHRARQRVADGRGIGIAVKWRDAGDYAVFNRDIVDAPVS